MVKTVIALSGPGGSGKTTTIVKAMDSFGDKHHTAPVSVEIAVNMKPEDKLVVFSVNSPKVKVGFASDCDIADKEYWDALKNEGCEIIVCATHTGIGKKDESITKLEKWCNDNAAKLIRIKQGMVAKPDGKQNEVMAAAINGIVDVEIQKRS